MTARSALHSVRSLGTARKASGVTAPATGPPGGGLAVFAEPGLVPVQARLEIVPGGEPRLLRLGDLLVEAGQQLIL